jgi:hypothetical protein
VCQKQTYVLVDFGFPYINGGARPNGRGTNGKPPAYSGGGSGDFITLHILDVAAARAFDLAGKVCERIDLTDLRRVALGDRWDGGISIAKKHDPRRDYAQGAGGWSGARETTMIVARRP